MSKIKVKKVGKGLDHLVRQVGELNDQNVRVGHFQEQGLHYSGYTFAELMQFHHTGGNPNGDSPVIPRPLLDILFHKLKGLNDRGIKSAFTRWKKRKPSHESNTKLLDDIGRRIAYLEKSMFGNPALLSGTPGNPNPLVDSGDLKRAVSYKTSLNPTLRKP